jgi:hypothetical protein
LQCVLAARILTVDFVVCTLAVKRKSGQVSTCRIGPFPCEIVGSSLSQCMHVYVRLFCVPAVPCVGSGLATV